MAQRLKRLPPVRVDPGSIPGSERSPGEGNGNLFQYSCLGNPIDRGVWRATVHGVNRIGHNLETKLPPPQTLSYLKSRTMCLAYFGQYFKIFFASVVFV